MGLDVGGVVIQKLIESLVVDVSSAQLGEVGVEQEEVVQHVFGKRSQVQLDAQVTHPPQLGVHSEHPASVDFALLPLRLRNTLLDIPQFQDGKHPLPI